MAGLQLDLVSLHAMELIRALSVELEAVPKDDVLVKNAAAMLLAWDGDCSADSISAAIFHEFHHWLLKNLLLRDLGPELFAAYAEILNQCIVPTDSILADAKSPWFAKCSRQEIVIRSLHDACAELQQTLGADTERWQWGEQHQLSINHALGRLSMLKRTISIRPIPTGGDGMTVNLGFYRHSNPYAQTVGAALRYVIDFNNVKDSGYVLASGQSGHPGSPHYRDQNELWRKGERIRLDLDIAKLPHSRHWLLKPV